MNDIHECTVHGDFYFVMNAHRLVAHERITTFTMFGWDFGDFFPSFINNVDSH